MSEVTSRRERERQERIRYILEVAERLFAERGFFRVTMRQIAKRAEFALGTLYAFFESKRHLYGRLMSGKMEEFVGWVTAHMASAEGPREQVERFVEAKLRFLRENLSFLRLYLAETQTPRFHSEEEVEPLRRSHRDLIGRLAQVFRRGIAEGVFVQLEPEGLARALDGLTSACACHWLEGDRSLPAERLAELAKRVFLRGVLKEQPPGGSPAC